MEKQIKTSGSLIPKASNNKKTTKIKPGKSSIPASNTVKQHYVAIGASAGGLEALNVMFDNVPNDHASYIILQHLSPDYKSIMKELLERHTTLQIRIAKNDMPIDMNCIYIMPHDQNLIVQEGKFKLLERTKAPNLSIDIFMASLAEEKGNEAIAVILSGAGLDGTKGVEAIKKAGGMVIVQDPVTAKFDGMPKSAIASGFVDVVLAPELIPEEINNYIKDPSLVNFYTEGINENDEATLKNILQIIRKKTARDFSSYKRPTIVRRLKRRMLHHNIKDLAVYQDFLLRNPEEIEILGREFLISVTKFFRDPEAYNEIKEKVIPEIFNKRPTSEPVKVWVIGCCTGEEAYSIAILIREHLDKINKEYDVKIFASDIDKESLEIAGKGIYSNHILNDVPKNYIEKYFTRTGDKYKVIPQLRKMIIFAQHDIISDPPFGKIDLLCCRNLLIYMNTILQQKLLSTFHSALNLGGFMFLGPSESKGDLKNVLADVSAKWKIYKNVESLRSIWYTPHELPLRGPIPLPVKETRSLIKNNLAELFAETILEEHGSAGVYIDENYEILKALGDFKRYLHLPEKMSNFNLLKMVPDELSIALGTGIQKTLKSNTKLTIRGVKVRDHKTIRTIDVFIKPFLSAEKINQKLILVLFDEAETQKISAKNQETFNKEIYFNERLTDLEQELKLTKDNLQAAIEELETSNEELQSANEELLSANEELQSTNEELQSLNEELFTVNGEHSRKINELIDLNDDMDNYFRATDISQIFVDRDLIIRKFTPASKKQINLIDSDIGRSIGHISNNIIDDSLIEDLKLVIKDSVYVEKNVETKNHKWYQMKILPYLRQDKIIDGAILTFADITNDLMKAEAETREKLKQQKDILNAVIETQEAERKRIGESLHNGLGQVLYTVKLKLESINGTSDPKVKKVSQDARALLLDAIQQTRAISSQLMPTILEDYGLESAINDIAKKLKGELKIKYCIAGFEKRLNSSIEIAVYRIIQELTNNIIKHAKATSAVIDLNNNNGKVTILVKDNGKGFVKNKDHIPGIGLSSIKSRVKLLNGQMVIDSRSTGTTVKIDFQM